MSDAQAGVVSGLRFICVVDGRWVRSRRSKTRLAGLVYALLGVQQVFGLVAYVGFDAVL